MLNLERSLSQRCQKANLLYFSFLALLCLFLCACAPSKTWTARELQELQQLFEARDYFELREKIEAHPESGSPAALFYRAAVETAFNRPAASNQTLRRIFPDPMLPDSLKDDLMIMQFYNFMRLHRYMDALEASSEILNLRHLDQERARDIRNISRMARALKDTPAQHVIKHADSELKIVQKTHLVLTINGRQRDYAYDTGANYSFLIRSEAEALGLPVLDAGLEVGSSTDLRVRADVAVADSLRVANIALRNVVFLVFPDEMFTFPDGFQIRGVVGFPVLEALGEIRFRKDGALFVPREPPKRAPHNLALANFVLLTRMVYEGEALVARLDTGAGKTEFYEPFFRRYFSTSPDPNRFDAIQSGGAGGVRELPVYRLGRVNLIVGNRTVTLDSAYAYTRALTSDSENYLFANIGLDLLLSFNEFILNFQDMAFLLAD
jgi:predicted aspartyl protease